jgi:hypothetical protein
MGQFSLSPDGRWFACKCVAPKGIARRWVAFPVANSQMAREIVLDPLGDQDFVVKWAEKRRTAQYVVSLQIESPPPPLSPRVSTKLGATAMGKDGRRVEVGALRWQSLDPTMARVDSITGLLTPMRSGTARVRATLGGWISRDTTIEIADRPVLTLLKDDWSEGVSKNFVPFGVPLPDVIETPALGHTMRNNGDGSFTSGVYTREEFSGDMGIGVELTVSTPIEMMQWQVLSIDLTPNLDSANLAQWDHRTGAMPQFSDSPKSARCSVGIPGGEKHDNFGMFSILGSATSRFPLPSIYRSGKPFRLALQLYPDGRCDVSIDGRVLGSAVSPPVNAHRYRVVIQGNSYKTQIGVGRVEIWSGIRVGY